MCSFTHKVAEIIKEFLSYPSVAALPYRVLRCHIGVDPGFLFISDMFFYSFGNKFHILFFAVGQFGEFFNFLI